MYCFELTLMILVLTTTGILLINVIGMKPIQNYQYKLFGIPDMPNNLSFQNKILWHV